MNLVMVKNKNTELYFANERQLRAIFEQHQPADGRISGSEMLKCCENLGLIPTRLSVLKAGKILEKLKKSKKLEEMHINFSEFLITLKEISSAMNSSLLSISKESEEFFRYIKSYCKSVYKADLISEIHELPDRIMKKGSNLAISVINLTERTKFEGVHRENSVKRMGNNASITDIRKLKSKLVNSPCKNSTQFICARDQSKRSLRKLENIQIIPMTYNKVSQSSCKTEILLDNFKKFKNSIGDCMKKSKRYRKCFKNPMNFVINQRKSLFSSTLVTRAIFSAWKSYIQSKKLMS